MPSLTLNVLRSRHVIYKVMLLLGFPLGLGLFLAGFASRRWTYTQAFTGEYNEIGLWEACVFTSHYHYRCFSTTGSSLDAEDWLVAVQVLQCLALAGLLIGLVLLIVVNFFQADTVLNRVAEAVTLIADVLGIVGSVVYAAKSFQAYSHLQDLQPYFMLQFVSVSYGLDLAGLLVLFFAVSMIALFDDPRASGTPVCIHHTVPH